MSGIVHGGWGYVFGAYIVTALVLGGYALRALVLHQLGKHLGGYDER